MTTPPASPLAEPVAQAAASVGVSADHLKREIRANRLRARLVAGKYIVARDDLRDWLEAQPEVAS